LAFLLITAVAGRVSGRNLDPAQALVALQGKWRGPKRNTFEEAQDDIDEHAAENPAAPITYHVLRKRDPDFEDA
jgi:hypothetical protein